LGGLEDENSLLIRHIAALGDTGRDVPPELLGTSLDPALSGEIPTKAQIDAEMKAIRSTRPIQIASFPC